MAENWVEYRCGTCDSPDVVVESAMMPCGELGWVITCGEGHEWIPTGAERAVIQRVAVRK